MRKLHLFLLLVVAAGASLTGAWWWLRPSPTPASRGAALAARLGCLGCHGPGGTGGVANPGSQDPEVPAWDGGVAMMYVDSEEQIREWILYGEPRREGEEDGDADEADHGAQDGDHGHDHDHDRDHGAARIDMPAFEGRIDATELADLVAYFQAVAAFRRWPEDDRVRRGWDAASRRGCFGCHGPSGQVPVANPGSLKGVIPAWDGDDFAELVRDDDELREWILDGSIPRLREHPIARRFLARQVISMPAYRGVVDDGELEDIVAYIRWLRAGAGAS